MGQTFIKLDCCSVLNVEQDSELVQGSDVMGTEQGNQPEQVTQLATFMMFTVMLVIGKFDGMLSRKISSANDLNATSRLSLVILPSSRCFDFVVAIAQTVPVAGRHLSTCHRHR